MLKPKNVDSILANFQRAIADLERVAEASQAEAAAKTEQAERLEDEARVASIEASRARSAANNIRALIESQA